MSKSAPTTSQQLIDLVGTPLREIREEFISVAEMQNQIMPDPDRLTVFGDYDIYGMTVPTAIVGGDFFDFIDVEGRFDLQGRVGIVIADASGHGLSAAMLIRDFNTALYTAISFQAHYAKDTTPLLFEKINRRMYRSSLPNQYISAFYGELHRDGRIRYINAGHLCPLIFRGRSAEELDVGGTVLGAFHTVPYPYQVGESKMRAGDLLLCYTDGISEAKNSKDQEYGLKRLKACVRKNWQLGSRAVFNAILADVERFSGKANQADDQTLIVIRKGGGKGHKTKSFEVFPMHEGID